MTRPDIAGIRERAEAATEGPWRWGDWGTTFGEREGEDRDTLERHPRYGGEEEAVVRWRGDECECILSIEDPMRPEDKSFIAHARADIPALLAYVAALEAWTIDTLRCVLSQESALVIHDDVLDALDELQAMGVSKLSGDETKRDVDNETAFEADMRQFPDLFKRQQ